MNNFEKQNQADKIINAAYKCIATKGYASVSLRQIADEAGVALSQLHYYFGSKKELFQVIIKKMMAQYLNKVEIHLKKGENAIEKTSSLISLFKNMLMNDKALFRLLCDFSSLAIWSDSFRSLLSSLFKELSDMIEAFLINSSYMANKFKDYSSKAMARMILGALIGMAMQALLDDDDSHLTHSMDAIQVIFE